MGGAFIPVSLYWLIVDTGVNMPNDLVGVAWFGPGDLEAGP